MFRHNPLRPGVLLSADLCNITQNRLLMATDSVTGKFGPGKFGLSEFGPGEFGPKYKC